MDYVVGSVAALVSGNVTPIRMKSKKMAVTPKKRKPSPNITPKSVLEGDRSIFMSPTLQKKIAIVKKSPKRIFLTPEEDLSNNAEDTHKSPKADKAKKQLKEDLEEAGNLLSPKSPRNKNSKRKKLEGHHNNANSDNVSEESLITTQVHNECSPKKRQTNKIKNIEQATDHSEIVSELNNSHINNGDKIPLKNNTLPVPSPQKFKNFESNVDKNETKDLNENEFIQENNSPLPIQNSKNKKKKHKNKTPENNENSNIKNNTDPKDDLENEKTPKKKKKRKQKNKSNTCQKIENTEVEDERDEIKKDTENSKEKNESLIVNPNAITDKDTDSEHDSDNEIESENEQNNKEVLDTGPPDDSSEEEEEKGTKKKVKVPKNINTEVNTAVNTEAEVKRTLFVGNVPFSVKCKKEIKKIFSKYGQIETVRIRTIPVKDGSVTPKLAVIKNELHPDRSTVNVYVKFHDASSVKKALAENGTVLNNCHLRVTPSDCTGSEHDPKCSVFVGNLPFALEDEALQQKFAQCGEIVSVRIIRDKNTNAGKGFGYVNFKSKDAVELALALSEEELTIKNRILRVKRCTQTINKQRREQDNNKNPQKGHERRNMQGNYERDNSRGNYGRENPQGNYGRGNSQGNYGRGNSQGNYGRGNSQGNYGRGNSQGNYGGGKAQSNYGRGNVQNRNQFRNGEENRQMGNTNHNDNKADGAMRRLMNKRKNQDSGEGPPNKVQKNIKQPGKKARKEFVGVTAEKKKKNKFNKGQKKKKVLSEILTK